jgi:protein arginine kinase activator
MFNCQRCMSPAVIHITEVHSVGQVDEVHLCENCYKALLAAQFQNPLASNKGQAESRSDKTCDSCGLSFQVFRNQGRFGCARDYEVFEEEITPLLESLHGQVRHVGKSPRRAPLSSAQLAELTQLRQQLQLLIREERYEEAARIRDRIRRLEQGDLR